MSESSGARAEVPSARHPQEREAEPTRLQDGGARLARALLGAALSGLGLAALEAHWSASALEQPASGGWLAVTGLLVPVALAIGAAVGLASLFLHPVETPSPGALQRALERGSARECSLRAWLLLLAAPAAFLWVFTNAKLALAWLVAEVPAPAAGAAMGAASMGSALLLALAVRGAAELLAARFPAVRPLPMLGIGSALLLLLGAVAIARGTTSGSGGVLAVFGVFKRPELDLRASALLLLIALGAYLAPAALGRLSARLALPLALAPLLLLAVSAQRLNEGSLSLAVERGSALSKKLLPVYRSLTDADGDGFGSSFGGGDCNDADPKVNPAADDVPGNGVDEDCSGSDARRLELAKPAQQAPADAEAWLEQKLDKKFNVLLITIDTLRWDLGYMGYERPVSPNIDKLAAHSTIFERAYALASYTSKSLPPMLIGKYPSETNRDWAHFNRFPKQDLFVQERLQQAGIFTLSVQGYWYFFHKGYGFERGFDVLDSSAAPKVVAVEGDRSSNSDKISDAAIGHLQASQLASQQFFMWVHYIDPHAEYAPHEGFDFGSDSRARYDGEVAFVDHHVGRLLQALEKQDYAERTAIIVTSDHGEAFGEHGMIRHGFEIWEELVRVPFIIHVPGAEPRRVKLPRSIIDVVPTILELQKLPAPSGEGADFISGHSLLRDVMMPPGHEPEPRIVFVDMSAGPNNAERQAFIENDLKLIASSGRTLGLYDLGKDPGEKEDLSKDKALAERVSERFKAFRRELELVHVRPR